jgi:hypothetical protein
MVAGGGDWKAEKGRSSARHRLHEDDTIYVEMNQLQRAGQVELIVNRASQAELTVSTGGSRGTPVPIAECSERTLALAVVLTPNSLDLGEDRLARADMLRLGAAKILDKRPGPSGDEYKCEFEPEWLAADLLEKTQMG